MGIYEILTTYNTVLGVAVLIVAIDSLVLLLDLYFGFIPKKARQILVRIMPWYIGALSVGTIAGPLVYQYVFAFPPCLLCWYQRIFMFVPAMIALWSTYADELRVTKKYLVTFFGIALLIGVNHYLFQWGIAPSALPCDATGQSVSCSGIDVLTLGFVTIPLMAVLANFGFIGTILWLSKNK